MKKLEIQSILCDRIIQGIKDEHVKTRLLDLDDDELTVENAIRICCASELTSKQVKLLGENSPVLHTGSTNSTTGKWSLRGRRHRHGRQRDEHHTCQDDRSQL